MIEKKSQTYNWIFITKGIGIILVVVGHFIPANPPEYWVILRNIIYLFHMPLFFILSGYLYRHGKYSYIDLITNKIKRLLCPFLSIALLFFVIKYLAGMVFTLEYQVGLQSVIALLVSPAQSYMPLLWFVHALFLIFLAYPLLRLVLRNNYLIFLLFLTVNVFFAGDYPVIGEAIENMPFFIAGVLLHESSNLKERVVSGDKNFILVTISFLLLYVASKFISVPDLLAYLSRFIFGILGTVAAIKLSVFLDRRDSFSAAQKVLTQVGYYSMTIYLFHTLFVSFVRILSYQVLASFNIGFIITAFIAIIAGVVFPLCLEKYFLRRYVLTKKYILGIW